MSWLFTGRNQHWLSSEMKTADFAGAMKKRSKWYGRAQVEARRNWGNKTTRAGSVLWAVATSHSSPIRRITPWFILPWELLACCHLAGAPWLLAIMHHEPCVMVIGLGLGLKEKRALTIWHAKWATLLKPIPWENAHGDRVDSGLSGRKYFYFHLCTEHCLFISLVRMTWMPFSYWNQTAKRNCTNRYFPNSLHGLHISILLCSSKIWFSRMILHSYIATMLTPPCVQSSRHSWSCLRLAFVSLYAIWPS